MGFFACYLLTPVEAPQRLRCTYVGFTVSPARRIRQHNGELVNGAKRTTKHRPWEMIVVVHGFPSKFHALQFEYAWQHPYICRFTKERLKPLKGTSGLGHPRSVKRKLIELHEMLHVSPWAAFPLTVSYTNATIQNIARTTSYFRWPAHMTCEVRALDEFVHRQSSDDSKSRCPESTCFVCDLLLSTSELRALSCYHSECNARYHSLCLADHFMLEATMESNTQHADELQLRPERGSCPNCGQELSWPLLLPGAFVEGAEKKRKARPSKKRRRDERTGCAPCDPFAHVHVNRCSEDNTSPPTTAKLDEADVTEEFDDTNWFEDEHDSCVEYLDVEISADRIGSSESSLKPSSPIVVDLTSTD